MKRSSTYYDEGSIHKSSDDDWANEVVDNRFVNIRDCAVDHSLYSVWLILVIEPDSSSASVMCHGSRRVIAARRPKEEARQPADCHTQHGGVYELCRYSLE